jgi:predicted permease
MKHLTWFPEAGQPHSESSAGKASQGRGSGALEVFAQDVRFSLRVLFKSPGFVAVAVTTLGLAIGANALVFAVMNALVLKTLPVPHSESLFAVERQDEILSYPNYIDLRDRNRSFAELATFTMMGSVLDKGKDAAQAYVAQTSGNYFDVLEVRPYLGRFYHAADERGPNSAPYVVLTYAYWRTRFEGDPGVIGRTVFVNKHPLTIIGVAPQGFQGALPFFPPDYFVPLVDAPEVNGWDGLTDRGNRWIMEAFGHLKPGVTTAQAVADLNRVEAFLEKTYPREVTHKRFTLSRPGLAGNLVGQGGGAFMAGMTLLAALILLAACANLGGLFAARTADRAHEVALRLALGSSRKRILWQRMTEAILLGLAGGVAGLALSLMLLRRLAIWQPLPSIPVHIPATPDAKVYVVALVLSLASGVLFGLVPARQVMRADPYGIVKAGSSARLGHRLTVRDVLLVIQIAICGILVTSSLVAIRGLLRSMHADYGFEPKGVMLASIDMSAAGYQDQVVPAMQRRMIDAMEEIPGVERAATINVPPLGLGGSGRTNVFSEQAPDLQASHATAMPFLFPTSPGYFEASRTSLLIGRVFDWHDDAHAPRVAVVNREMARMLFGTPDKAIGGRFRLADGTLVEVIGVVENGKYQSLTEPLSPAVFLPNEQRPWGQTTLVVRSRRDPTELAAAMRQKLHELDPAMAVNIQTWTDLLRFALLPARISAVSLGVLGLMGALISLSGIFGMAAYSVSKRMRELGIRVALGAQRWEVLRVVLGRTLALLAIGSAAGLILGVLASEVLAHVVYQATARDPLVLAGVVAAMALLGLVATWIPAQRALALDPLVLLREE